MTQTAAIHLPKMHAGQAQVMAERRRRNVLSNGRRWGKNIFLQILATETAIRGGFVGWSAPVYKQTLDDYRAMDNILAPVITRKSGSEMRLEIVGGGVVEFWSLDKPDTIRGKKYHRFIVNEAGFVHDLMHIRNNIIMPTLIDYRGDEWYSGTPKGMNGFFNLFNQRGDEWARWQMSSYSNPHIPAAELDGLKDLMPERTFAQEIQAQFLEDGGGVFRRIREAAILQVQPPVLGDVENNISAHQYVIGVDWGRSNDATVFCVFDADTKNQVYLDRMTDTDYATQRTRLNALSNKYNNAVIIAEANSIGQPNIEALQSMGLSVQSFTTTNATKSQVIQSLELAFERGNIKILENEMQTAELMAYESNKLPSGLIRYSSPEGMHDDCVMAMAIGWRGVLSGNVEVEENFLYN